MAERPPTPPHPQKLFQPKGCYVPGIPSSCYEKLADAVQTRLSQEGDYADPNEVEQGPPTWHSLMVAGEEIMATRFSSREEAGAAQKEGLDWFEDAKEAIEEDPMDLAALQVALDALKAHGQPPDGFQLRGGGDCTICKEHPDHFSHW